MTHCHNFTVLSPLHTQRCVKPLMETKSSKGNKTLENSAPFYYRCELGRKIQQAGNQTKH